MADSRICVLLAGLLRRGHAAGHDSTCCALLRFRQRPSMPGLQAGLKSGRQAFRRGIKLEKSHNLDQAIYEFQAAANLVRKTSNT